MPRPMTRQVFKERLHEMREALGIDKFDQPPAQQPDFEAPEPEQMWELLRLIEEIIRRQRQIREELPKPRPIPMPEKPV